MKEDAIKEIIKIANDNMIKHRFERVITCDKDCWCWDVDYLTTACACLGRENEELKELVKNKDFTSLAKEIHEQCQNGASISDIIQLLADTK